MKPFLVGLLAAILVLAGWGSLAPTPATAESTVAQVPGNTVVQDDAGDLFLKNAEPPSPWKPCSLPPGVPSQSPPWTDIKTAKITQLGRGLVELSIALQEPVPETPTYTFVAYIWVFMDSDIIVWWNGESWQGHWSGEPINTVQFRFSDETVQVRLGLEELMLKGATGDKLMWKAAVRRMPISHHKFTNTKPVDLAPYGLDNWATWMPR